MSIQVLDTVWRHSRHKGGTLLVLLALADNADDETGRAYPSIAYLAEKTRLSERAVQYAVKALIDSGELTLIERGGRHGAGVSKANTYRLNTQSLRLSPDRLAERKAQLAAEKAQSTTNKDAAGCTLTVSRTVSREPSEKKPLPDPDSARVLFEHWKTVTDRNGSTKLTPNRRRAIEARLREGYTEARIQRAIDGCAGSKWHRQNGHTDLTLICRNGEKLEGFEAMSTSSSGGRKLGELVEP